MEEEGWAKMRIQTKSDAVRQKCRSVALRGSMAAQQCKCRRLHPSPPTLSFLLACSLLPSPFVSFLSALVYAYVCMCACTCMCMCACVKSISCPVSTALASCSVLSDHVVRHSFFYLFFASLALVCYLAFFYFHTFILACLHAIPKI